MRGARPSNEATHPSDRRASPKGWRDASSSKPTAWLDPRYDRTNRREKSAPVAMVSGILMTACDRNDAPGLCAHQILLAFQVPRTAKRNHVTFERGGAGPVPFLPAGQ